MKKRGTIYFITIIVLLCVFLFITSSAISAQKCSSNKSGGSCVTRKCPFASKTTTSRSTQNIIFIRRRYRRIAPVIAFPEISPANNKKKKKDDPPCVTTADRIGLLEEIFSNAVQRTTDSNMAEILEACFNANSERVIYESCYTKELENKILEDVNAPEKAKISMTAKVLARNSYQEAFEYFQSLKNPEEKTKEWEIFKQSLVKELKQAGTKEGYKKFETIGTGNFLRRLWACRAINPATNRALYTRENIDPSVEPQARNVLNMLAGLTGEGDPNSPPSPPSESSEQQQEALNQPTINKPETSNIAAKEEDKNGKKN